MPLQSVGINEHLNYGLLFNLKSKSVLITCRALEESFEALAMKFNAFHRPESTQTKSNTPESSSGVQRSSRSRSQTPQASRNASQRPSIARERSAYNTLSIEDLDRLQGEMVVSSLWQEQQKMQYTSCPPEPNEGVVIRSPQLNKYMCYPPSLREENQPLWLIAQELNLRVSLARNQLMPSLISVTSCSAAGLSGPTLSKSCSLRATSTISC